MNVKLELNMMMIDRFTPSVHVIKSIKYQCFGYHFTSKPDRILNKKMQTSDGRKSNE